MPPPCVGGAGADPRRWEQRPPDDPPANPRSLRTHSP
jgi:hypothetical protein